MSLVEQEKGMETYMFERKMDNCKPCGGAIPLCMIDEFSLPEKIVDRKVSTHTQWELRCFRVCAAGRTPKTRYLFAHSQPKEEVSLYSPWHA